MQRLGSVSNQWVFYLTAVLLVAACVLRSILVYAYTPVLFVALALLVAWSVLFLTEAEISRRWPAYFPAYLVLQIILGVLLLSSPGYPDSYAILFALAVSGVMLYPLLKWTLVGIVAVPLCFALGHLIRKLPYTERIL